MDDFSYNDKIYFQESTSKENSMVNIWEIPIILYTQFFYRTFCNEISQIPNQQILNVFRHVVWKTIFSTGL